MSITIHNYEHSYAEEWDAFCKRSHQGTFLHSRRFLSYHGGRFCDRSLILKDEGVIVALLPAAEQPGDPETVVSHPGITYGGLLHAGKVIGEDTIEAFQSVATHYKKLGYKRFIYKAVPSIYHQAPCEDDLYAMFRLGALRVRCDLSSTINLTNRLPVNSRRKRSLIKSEKAGVRIERGFHLLENMWEVLNKNLKTKHNAKPVHTIEEIISLANLFPDNIQCYCAILGSEIVAGVVIFKTTTCLHAQYIASSEIGYNISALDLVFQNLIEEAIKLGCQWFDFGTSNENGGLILNQGLYRFKTEFGGGGMAYECYQLQTEKK